MVACYWGCSSVVWALHYNLQLKPGAPLTPKKKINKRKEKIRGKKKLFLDDIESVFMSL